MDILLIEFSSHIVPVVRQSLFTHQCTRWTHMSDCETTTQILLSHVHTLCVCAVRRSAKVKLAVNIHKRHTLYMMCVHRSAAVTLRIMLRDSKPSIVWHINTSVYTFAHTLYSYLAYAIRRRRRRTGRRRRACYNYLIDTRAHIQMALYILHTNKHTHTPTHKHSHICDALLWSLVNWNTYLQYISSVDMV